MMGNDKKITRKEFLGVLGGMAVAAVALKVANLTSTVHAVLPSEVISADTNTAYGQSAYGGKNA